MKFDSETTPYSTQSSLSTTYTVDVVKELYLAPAATAAGVGLLLALVITLIATSTDLPLTFIGAVKLMLIAWFSLTVFLFWAFYTGAVTRFERRTGIDYNRDGMIGGQPAETEQPAPTEIRVELHDQQGQYIGADIAQTDHYSDLRTLARGWADGKPLVQTQWEKTMGRAAFNVQRDWLIENGFAAWVSERGNPKSGWQLTRRGELLFQRMAEK